MDTDAIEIDRRPRAVRSAGRCGAGHEDAPEVQARVRPAPAGARGGAQIACTRTRRARCRINCA